jgi:hypothetical protein
VDSAMRGGKQQHSLERTADREQQRNCPAARVSSRQRDERA